jgi:drug/metabolite transporter (DMT)-like permease
MKNLTSAIIVFAISIASLSFGNILLKLGMDRYGMLTAAGMTAGEALWKVPQLTAGAVLMLTQFGCTLILFKWGWDASVVIPVMGLCYLLMALLGKYMLGEPVNAMRWLGISLIVLGVFFVARSNAPGKAV